MLLQTNSYIVPKEKRAEHARLMRRFRQVLNSLGCDDFEIFEQVGANWSNGETTGRFVQIMRFRDRKHQVAVQNAERTDPAAQQLIAEFCALVNYPYQQQQGQFAVGFYSSILPVAPGPVASSAEDETAAAAVATPTDPAHVPDTTAFAADTPSEEPIVASAADPTAGQPTVPESTADAAHAADHHQISDPAESPVQPDGHTEAPAAPSPSPVGEQIPESAGDPLDHDQPAHAPIDGADSGGPALDAFAPLEQANAAEHPEETATPSTLHDDLTDLDVLEGDLELDDDLSRLANELASREELGDAPRPSAGNNGPHHGRASDNGAR